MSEPPPNDVPAPEADAPVPEPPARRGASGRTTWRAAALWLAVLLAVVVAGGLSAPFWSPPLAAFLPWGRNSGTSREQTLEKRLAALARRDAALQAGQQQASRRLAEEAAAIAGLKSSLAGLDKRINAAAARPAVDPAAVKKLHQDMIGLDKRAGDLAVRIGAVESGLSGLDKRFAAAAPAADAATIRNLQRQIAGLGQRVDAAAARPAVDPATMTKLQQDVAGLDKRAGDLGHRVAALESRMAARKRSADREAGLLTAVLQMRERLDAGRPFAAQYAAFAALARDRPKLLAAAGPLASLANGGVASRAALARDLSRLAGAIATARAPAAANDWGGRVLDQLHRLVTIRRIDGRQGGPQAAVERAEADLARGDLAAAAAAIGSLTGAPAAAAQPWLAAARRRLAAEGALAQAQRRLEADLLRRSAPAAPAAAPSSKPGAPSQPAAGKS